MSSRVGSSASILAVSALVLTACGSPAPDPNAYVGQTLDAAFDHLDAPNVIDLSQPIAGREPTYDESEDPSAWIVVVGCTEQDDPETSDLGVIPTTAVTAAIRSAAKRGEFDRYVPSCRR